MNEDKVYAEAYHRMILGEQSDTITLYRGLVEEFDPTHDLTTTDAPDGYSTWTDNVRLAEQYAGIGGHIYTIELPLSEMGDDYISMDGDRYLFFNNDKPAGLNGINGDEYLVYIHHELYDNSMVKFDHIVA